MSNEIIDNYTLKKMIPKILYIFNFYGYIYFKEPDGNGIIQAFRSEFCSQIRRIYHQKSSKIVIRIRVGKAVDFI